MEKETVIVWLLAAVVVVSVLQTFQIIEFSNAVASLKAISASAPISAPAAAPAAGGGLGGC
ncbi:Uncharacterised protein [uncultured archaeon]|nr:Uncharacterised protein [uncultured archaeon]